MTALSFRPVFAWNDHKYALGLTGSAVVSARKIATASFAASILLDDGKYKLAVHAAYAGGFSAEVIDLPRESAVAYDRKYIHSIGNRVAVETQSKTLATAFKGLQVGRKNGLITWKAGKNILTAGKLGLPYDMTATASVTLSAVKGGKLSGLIADDGQPLAEGESLVTLPQAEGIVVDFSGQVEGEELLARLMNFALA